MKKALVVIPALLLLALPVFCQASFSGANGRIFFVSKSSSAQQIYSVRPSGTGRAQVTRGALAPRSPDVSPDGRTLAFVATSGPSRIMTCPAAGGRARLVVSGASPAFSPRGGTLAYTTADGMGGSNLRTINLRTKKSRLVFAGQGEPLMNPVWSADGQSIFFSRATGGSDTEIYSVSSFGGQASAVSPGFGTSYADFSRPDTAPDGSGLLAEWSSIDSGGTAVAMISLIDSTSDILWSPPEFAALRYLSPVYSPDGSLFLYSTFDYSGKVYSLSYLPLALDSDGESFALPNSRVYPEAVWAPAVAG